MAAPRQRNALRHSHRGGHESATPTRLTAYGYGSISRKGLADPDSANQPGIHTAGLDEWAALDPARCWNEGIRRGFRAMTGDRRKHWRRLLKHIRGNAPQRMPTGWAREAEERLASVGVDDFSEQLSLWFAPFRSGQPLPLSVAGSHILKGLIWYAAVSRDERAKQSALWLLDVKWKQKRNITKSMVALEVFGISKDELLSRNLIKEVTSPPPRILEKVLEVLSYPTASTHIVAEPEGDLIVVQGQNWPAIPDEFRLRLKRECDSDEQLRLRATLLMYDSSMQTTLQ